MKAAEWTQCNAQWRLVRAGCIIERRLIIIIIIVVVVVVVVLLLLLILKRSMVNISVRSSCTVSDSAKNRRLYYFKVEASD